MASIDESGAFLLLKQGYCRARRAFIEDERALAQAWADQWVNPISRPRWRSSGFWYPRLSIVHFELSVASTHSDHPVVG
jgi:hypothetical protein